MVKNIKKLPEYGEQFNILDPNGCTLVEPALTAIKDSIAGGLHTPSDETGDCYLFAQKLAKNCKDQGVRFELSKAITSVEYKENKISAVLCGGERFVADHYVVALGSFSYQLMKIFGIKIPVYPVKGYSLTIPITNPEASPVSSILDETYQVAITRFDQRIRVAGIAELSGYNLNLNKHRLATLKKVVTELYPNGGDLSKAIPWVGMRPLTPDGTPIIGATRICNLSLNTGHGTMGFSMSLGSGKLLADSIIGQKPEIAADRFLLQRFEK